MTIRWRCLILGATLGAGVLGVAVLPAADTKLADETPALVSLRRPHYFTGDLIGLRSKAWHGADAGDLIFQLASDDGSRLRILFQPIGRPFLPEEAIDPDGPVLQSWLLRPGSYTVDATAGNGRNQARFELFSGVRRSTFTVIDAGFDGSITPLAPRGEEGLGFNALFPFADRVGVSPAWTSATDSLIVGVPPGDGVQRGLWLPSISDPLRRSKDLSDGSSEAGTAGVFDPPFRSALSRARDPGRVAASLPIDSPRDSGVWQLERNLAFMAGDIAISAGPLSGGEARVSPQLLETVIASNKLAQRLGTIFTAMPASRSPAALLVSQEAAADVDRRALLVYLAGQLANIRLTLVTPADLLDGTVSRHHKVIVVPAAGPLDARSTGVLNRFVQTGGTVLTAPDSTAEIAGSRKLSQPIDTAHFDQIDRLVAEGKPQDAARLRRPIQLQRVAEPLSKSIQAAMEAAGVRPAMSSDSPFILISRHGYGDITYYFLVNANSEEGGAQLSLRPATATVSLTGDGGFLYDAINGGTFSALKPDGAKLSGVVRFGPGQLRVLAQTARPVGGVQLAAPQVVSNYKAASLPIRLELSAAVVDLDGRLLNGAVPLRVRVTDPLGGVRYDLWRSAERGHLKLDLPLAANDAAGQWTVSVREMLARTAAEARFEYRPPASVGAIAGWTTGHDAVRGVPRVERPAAVQTVPAAKNTRPREATVAWRSAMPDRVVSIQVEQEKLTVFSHDGSATKLDLRGAVLSQAPTPVLASPRPPEPLPPAVTAGLLKDRAVKRSATDAGLTAVGYWGGTVQIFGPDGTVRSEQTMPSGVADLLWFDGKLVVGLSDGEVLALTLPG